MISQVIPINTPTILWENYIKAFKATTGISPTKRVDACSRELSDLAKFLSSLSPDTEALSALRSSDRVTKHMAFSFFVGTTREVFNEILEYGGLRVTVIHEEHQASVILISGDLDCWVQLIKLIMKPEKTPESRHLANLFLRYFESLGLAELWHDQKKKSLPDGTLLLEDKK